VDELGAAVALHPHAVVLREIKARDLPAASPHAAPRAPRLELARCVRLVVRPRLAEPVHRVADVVVEVLANNRRALR
jgi:hypothetical protein